MPFVRISDGSWQCTGSANNSVATTSSDPSSPVLTRRSAGPSCQALRNALSALYRLDDFNLEPIGAGFFSRVYKAVHLVSGEVMVLKINTQPSNRLNFLREIQLLNKLAHPNILKFIGVCVSEGQLQALTEYVDGGCLEQLIADKSHDLSWPVRIRLACDIAKGLKYLHNCGIMHRDLTSKNILIRRQRDGRLSAVVADLGLAASIPDPRYQFTIQTLPYVTNSLCKIDKRMSVVGSPYWMAPECIVGLRYNEKADVFSYGIVLCELIARVEADPDILPRTNKFGLDYVAFSKMAADCPLHFLHLTFICCQIEPWKRPSFAELVHSLEAMKYSALMAVILMDLNRLDITTTNTAGATENTMDRAALESILDVRRHKRTRSDAQNICSAVCNSNTAGVVITTSRRIVPVTPLTVGRVMSRDDAHYTPHATNPFAACYRDAGVKVINGLPVSDLHNVDMKIVTTPACEVRQVKPRRRLIQRSQSLPGSPVSRQDRTVSTSVTAAVDCSDTVSSADSAVGLDFVCSSRHVDSNVALCLEDCEVLFDDEISRQLRDDASSFVSTFDETGLLSPASSYSSRDDCSDISQVHHFELHSVFWHERFQSLLRRWEERQATVNAALLPARLRLAVPYLVQFAELRCLWEDPQQQQQQQEQQQQQQQQRLSTDTQSMIADNK